MWGLSLVGLLLLLHGLYRLVRPPSAPTKASVGSAVSARAEMLFAVGFIVVGLVTMVGSVGALRNMSPLLVAFAGLLGACFLLAGGILILVGLLPGSRK